MLENEEGDQIAIWGVLDRSISIMDDTPILRNPDIVFVDNAYWKQKVILNGKRVYNPSVIAEKNMSTVITFYVEMGSFQHILTYTQKFCPTVKRIIRANYLLQGFEL